MNKWDELRQRVDSFDLQYEITRVDLSRPRDADKILKEIKQEPNCFIYDNNIIYDCDCQSPTS